MALKWLFHCKLTFQNGRASIPESCGGEFSFSYSPLVHKALLVSPVFFHHLLLPRLNRERLGIFPWLQDGQQALKDCSLPLELQIYYQSTQPDSSFRNALVHKCCALSMCYSKEQKSQTWILCFWKAWGWSRAVGHFFLLCVPYTCSLYSCCFATSQDLWTTATILLIVLRGCFSVAMVANRN